MTVTYICSECDYSKCAFQNSSTAFPDHIKKGLKCPYMVTLDSNGDNMMVQIYLFPFVSRNLNMMRMEGKCAEP